MTSAPHRTCIGCRQVRPQAGLIRLVRSGDGGVVVDGGRRAEGRGAYVCASLDCVSKAFGKGRLEHAFRGPCTRPVGGAGGILAARGRVVAAPGRG